jgi:hypothetical protein
MQMLVAQSDETFVNSCCRDMLDCSLRHYPSLALLCELAIDWD